MTSWWALAINFKLFMWLNCSDMSCKVGYETSDWKPLNFSFYISIRIKGQVWNNKNLDARFEITWPNVYPAPRGEMPQPHRSSGSDHNKSHIGPSCGTSWTRSKFRMLSRVSMDGDSPPCRQNISDSTWKEKQKPIDKTIASI